MWFLTVALKNLVHRKIRSILTCVGMGVAACAFISMIGITQGIENSVVSLFESRGTDIIVCPARVPQRLIGRLSTSLGPRLRQVPGVRSAEPVLVDLVSFDQGGLMAVLVMGWVVESGMFDDLEIVGGRRLQHGDRRAVLVGKFLANNLGKQVGDTIEIEDAKFTVIGIYQSANLLENGMAVVALGELQELMGRAGEATIFRVGVDERSRNKQAIAEICRRLEHLRNDQGQILPLSAMTTKDHVGSNLELRAARATAWAMSITALLIGVIGVLNTMMVSVFERTREIGTLLALGWQPWRIAAMVLLEALVLCCVGAALGALMSIGLTLCLSVYDAAAPFLPRTVSPWVMAQGAALTVVVGLIGAVLPAVRAARLLPTEALRHE